MKIEFPKKFLWGSSTSAHQVEGNNKNDWVEWEKENAKRLALEAKDYYKPWQQKKFPEMFDWKNYISGSACDHYNRYESDLDLAKSLNQNAYCFSIEWARIEPEEGKFDENEIEHYRKMIRACKERGIEPFVKLWHWTNPLWISRIGGFENKETVKYFVRYATKIADTLGKEAKFWISFNEPQSYLSLGYLDGRFPPHVKNFFRARRVFYNLIEAHKKTYKIFHDKLNVQFGSSNAILHLVPHKDTFINKIFIEMLNYMQLGVFMKRLKGYHDFIGLQYYNHLIMKAHHNPDKVTTRIRDEADNISDLGWEISPDGIYHIMKHLKNQNIPIYITENGIATRSDKVRENFIKHHLTAIHKAMKEGVDVRGYFYWSLLDNFEWADGYWPKFGLISWDKNTQEREIKKSALAYAKICKTGKFIITKN